LTISLTINLTSSLTINLIIITTSCGMAFSLAHHLVYQMRNIRESKFDKFHITSFSSPIDGNTLLETPACSMLETPCSHGIHFCDHRQCLTSSSSEI